MVKVAYSLFLLSAALSVFSLAPAARSAVGPDATQLAEVGSNAGFADTADVELRFIQEDGPASGHVRVVLTPETRPLTLWEARSAAEQGFLEALKEPGLGDDIKRITVVVRLMPKSHPDPGVVERVFRFQHKGGQTWSVLAGD